MPARPRFRTTFLLALAVTLAVPRPAAAQLDVTGACVPPGCGSIDFFLANVTAPNHPLNLTGLQLDLLNGWLFTGGAVTGADDVGPFGPFAATLSGGGASAFLDFAEWIDWFALDDEGSTGSVRMGVTEGDGGLGFAWSATDVSGATYSGTFGEEDPPPPPPQVVPEPGSMALLGTGLVAIGVIGRRRRRRYPGG